MIASLAVLLLVGRAPAVEVREVDAYREARVEPGISVVIGSDWLEPGTVVLDCDHPSLEVAAREGVLHVRREGSGPLPARCEVALHADQARGLVVDGAPSRPTRLRVEPGARHVMSRIVAADLDLTVEGLGRLVVKELTAERLRVQIDRGEARFADLEARALTVTARRDGRVLVSSGEVGHLDVTAAGRARVDLDGEAGTARVVARGDAVVDGGPLLVGRAEVRAAGRAEVWLVVTDAAKVAAGGRSLVGIPGEPASMQATVRGRARVQ